MQTLKEELADIEEGEGEVEALVKKPICCFLSVFKIAPDVVMIELSFSSSHPQLSTCGLGNDFSILIGLSERLLTNSSTNLHTPTRNFAGIDKV